MTMHINRSRAAALLAFMLCGPLHALENAWELQAGVGSTSNVLRVPVNPQQASISVLGATLALSQSRSRLEVAALGALEFQKYQADIFASDLVGNFRGRAIGTLVPERLRWVGEYYFGQTRINGFAPPTPDNRQNVSAFSTGPSLNQAIGASNRLRVDLRHTDFHYEISQLNTRRLEARGALVHDLSSRAHLSLNANTQRAKFTQQTRFADFDQQEAFGRLGLSNSRSLVNLDLGYTRARNDAAWSGGVLARLIALRRLSSTTSVNLALGRAYSDSGSSFVQLQSQSGGTTTTTATSQAVADQFLNEFATAGWALRGNRSAVEIEVRHFRETYQRLAVNNRKRSAGSVLLGREFTESLAMELRGVFEREQYDVSSRAFDERSAGAGLTWKPGRALFVHADYTRIKRVGDAAIPSFDDTQLWLRIGYARGSVSAMSAASSLQDAAMMDTAAALDRGLGSWE